MIEDALSRNTSGTGENQSLRSAVMADGTGQGLVVVVFGATGTAGSGAVQAALDDPGVAEVRAVTRRPLERSHPKLVEVTCSNFADLRPIAGQLASVDICLFCLGISATRVKEEERYREIHVTYAVAAARALAAASPRAPFVYLSGGGAKRTSRMMWARVKAEAEDQLSELNLARQVNVRPGYILPTASTWMRTWVIGPLLTLIPFLGIRADDLGRAMLKAARFPEAPDKPLNNTVLRRLVETGRIAETPVERRARRTRTIVGTGWLFLAVAVLITVLSGGFSVERTAAAIRGAGSLGIAGYLMAFALLQPLGLSGGILAMSAGLIWQWWLAVPLALAGSVMASVNCYLLARYVAFDWVQSRLPQQLRRFESWLVERGVWGVIGFRLLTWTTWLAMLMMGTTRVRLSTMLVGTIIGFIPRVFLSVLIYAEVTRAIFS